jgi:hypothetical protein
VAHLWGRSIHRSAWKGNSLKSVYGKLHNSTLGNVHMAG